VNGVEFRDGEVVMDDIVELVVCVVVVTDIGVFNA
jgi:hypothetical protein